MQVGHGDEIMNPNILNTAIDAEMPCVTDFMACLPELRQLEPCFKLNLPLDVQYITTPWKQCQTVHCMRENIRYQSCTKHVYLT